MASLGRWLVSLWLAGARIIGPKADAAAKYCASVAERFYSAWKTPEGIEEMKLKLRNLDRAGVWIFPKVLIINYQVRVCRARRTDNWQKLLRKIKV